jgi:hypothetical protein
MCGTPTFLYLSALTATARGRLEDAGLFGLEVLRDDGSSRVSEVIGTW